MGSTSDNNLPIILALITWLTGVAIFLYLLRLKSLKQQIFILMSVWTCSFSDYFLSFLDGSRFPILKSNLSMFLDITGATLLSVFYFVYLNIRKEKKKTWFVLIAFGVFIFPHLYFIYQHGLDGSMSWYYENEPPYGKMAFGLMLLLISWAIRKEDKTVFWIILAYIVTESLWFIAPAKTYKELLDKLSLQFILFLILIFFLTSKRVKSVS